MSILRVQGVSKSFKDFRALQDVSFSLEEGDNLAIIGESGSGKTTLAKMLMGLIEPDTGSIMTQGRLQMVFQDPYNSLDPLWSVQEILKEALWPGPVDQLRMEKILEAVGLSPEVLSRFPHEFSGGERQRIAIARSLLASPKVLILDEAVSALDTLVQKQIMNLLRKLKQDFNLTYIFISHNLRLVRQFSDKIIVIYEGKIVEQGEIKAVLHSPLHPYTRELMQAAFYSKMGKE